LQTGRPGWCNPGRLPESQIHASSVLYQAVLEFPTCKQGKHTVSPAAFLKFPHIQFFKHGKGIMGKSLQISIIKPGQAKFVTAYLVDNSDTASKLSSAPVWTP